MASALRLDHGLFAAAQAGDPLALDRLLRQLQPDVRRYAQLLLLVAHRTSGKHPNDRYAPLAALPFRFLAH